MLSFFFFQDLVDPCWTCILFWGRSAPHGGQFLLLKIRPVVAAHLLMTLPTVVALNGKIRLQSLYCTTATTEQKSNYAILRFSIPSLVLLQLTRLSFLVLPKSWCCCELCYHPVLLVPCPCWLDWTRWFLFLLRMLHLLPCRWWFHWVLPFQVVVPISTPQILERLIWNT